MEITQRFTINQPIDVVWRAFSDVRLVADCLAGAEITDIPDDSHCSGRFVVKLGPISASFKGGAEIIRDDTNYTGMFEGKGLDQQSGSRSQGKIAYELSQENDGRETVIAIKAEFILSGALAQFGRSSLINDIAGRLTADFANTLQQKLSGTTTGEIQRAMAQDVHAFSLLGSVFWNRIVSVFKRLFG